jgi:phage N-6-adenine-methyltransferase
MSGRWSGAATGSTRKRRQGEAMSENFLLHIDAAKREILAADSLLKIKDLWNKADAMRALGQAAKDPELVNHATEFKLRCERRLGEMLIAMKERGEITEGRNSRTPTRVKIADMDFSYDISARAQRIASVPEEKFEAAIVAVREEEEQITRRTIEEMLSPSRRLQCQVWAGEGDPEYYTPEIYIESVRRALGEIDLDPASNDEAQKTVKAKDYFTKETDGLKQEWRGRVFLNPPYAHPPIADFTKKLCAEFYAGNIVAAILLTNDNTDTKWWHEAANASQAICFTLGRINFYKPNGAITQPTNGQTFFISAWIFRALPRSFQNMG